MNSWLEYPIQPMSRQVPTTLPNQCRSVSPSVRVPGRTEVHVVKRTRSVLAFDGVCVRPYRLPCRPPLGLDDRRERREQRLKLQRRHRFFATVPL
jgi:hypothetical protein